MQFLKKNSVLIGIFCLALAACIYWYPSTASPPPVPQEHTTQEAQTTTTPKVYEKEGDDDMASRTELANEHRLENVPAKPIAISAPVDIPAEAMTEEPEKETQTQTITATLNIPSQHISEKISLFPGASAYDLMYATLARGTLSFSGTNYGSRGFFLESIGSVKNDYREKMYWIYYINGNKATIGLSHYILQDTDIITWQYEPEEH